jgi:hypothetical protein
VFPSSSSLGVSSETGEVKGAAMVAKKSIIVEVTSGLRRLCVCEKKVVLSLVGGTQLTMEAFYTSRWTLGGPIVQ